MSPEQVRGEELDERTPFLLGLVLLKCHRRQLLWNTSGSLVRGYSQSHAVPAVRLNQRFLRNSSQIINKALEKDRMLRYPRRGPSARPAASEAHTDSAPRVFQVTTVRLSAQPAKRPWIHFVWAGSCASAGPVRLPIWSLVPRASRRCAGTGRCDMPFTLCECEQRP